MRNSSTICADANLVVRLVAVYEDDAAQQLWRRWRQDRRAFAAPRLIRYEVTNALHRLRQAGDLTEDETQRAFRAALALPIRLHDDEPIHGRALAIAARFSLPAAYDAHYLALADQLGTEFWTADRRLASAVQPALPWVRLVGE